MAEQTAAAKRIGFFLPDLHGGGAERVVLSLCRRFISEGVSVDLILARAEGILLAEVPDKVRVVDLAPRLRLPTRAGLAVGALLGMVGYLRREPPAALVASLTGANLVALLAHRLAGVATRVVLREANTAHNLNSFLVRRWVRALYPSADTIIAVSHGVRNDLVEVLGIAASKIRVVYNPVDVDELRRLANKPLPEPWFAPEAPPVILGVGRLVPQKDFATLLRAFAIVRQTQRVRIILLGEGPLRPTLESLASELGVAEDVAIPGFVTNPYAYMQRAAVFVLSSRWEGLPNVLVQALSVGVPVVATDCHSGPSEVLDHGRFGWLVPVADPEALAAAIVKALAGVAPADTAARIERAGHFSLDCIAQQYLEVLNPAA